MSATGAGDNVLLFPARRAAPRVPARAPHDTGLVNRTCLRVAAIVADACGVRLGDVVSGQRGKARVSAARHIAIYICCVDLELPRSRVGATFRRHRRNVWHILKDVEDRRDDPAFDAALNALEERVAGGFGRRQIDRGWAAPGRGGYPRKAGSAGG